MEDLKELVAKWEASGGSGMSAKSIIAQLTGFREQFGHYPSDASDFGRCEALLDAVPVLREVFAGMAHVNAYWEALVPAWDDIKAADDQTAAIKAIITPIEAADPTHFRMSKEMSMTVGKITFKGSKEKPMPDGGETPQTGQQVLGKWDDDPDPLYAKAAAIIVESGKCSTSLVQRKLAIGYNRAARLVERMEEQGIVSAADHIGHREVVTTDEIKAVVDAMTRTVKQAVKHPKAIPMKNTPEDIAVDDKVYRVTANELRQFVERLERLDAEKKDLAEQQKEVMAEAKSRGYDTKCLRKVIALRKRDKDDIAEEQAVMDLYLEALGM